MQNNPAILKTKYIPQFTLRTWWVSAVTRHTDMQRTGNNTHCR